MPDDRQLDMEWRRLVRGLGLELEALRGLDLESAIGRESLYRATLDALRLAVIVAEDESC